MRFATLARAIAGMSTLLFVVLALACATSAARPPLSSPTLSSPPLSESARAARADTLVHIDTSATRSARRAARAPSPAPVHVRLDGDWNTKKADLLWVVDGVVLDLRADSNVDLAEAQRAIQRLDPKKIVRIEFLKNMTAIERFGRAGHDGVVLVTTTDSAAKSGERASTPRDVKRP